MANATTPLGGKVSDSGVAKMPLAAVKIIKGTMCYTNATGFATNAADTAAFIPLGVAKETVDNSGGAAGDKIGEFWTEGQFKFTGPAMTQADVGKKVYFTDNQTFALTTANTVPPAGVIREIVTSTTAMIEVTPPLGT